MIIREPTHCLHSRGQCSVWGSVLQRVGGAQLSSAPLPPGLAVWYTSWNPSTTESWFRSQSADLVHGFQHCTPHPILFATSPLRVKQKKQTAVPKYQHLPKTARLKQAVFPVLSFWQEDVTLLWSPLTGHCWYIFVLSGAKWQKGLLFNMLFFSFTFRIFVTRALFPSNCRSHTCQLAVSSC